MLTFSDQLLTLTHKAQADLRERFEAIDALSFLNQKKVLEAFRAERVSTECFNPTSGYGYDDMGREVLDRVYARVFEAEAAFVRHNLLSGTHALTVALFGLLRPNDTLLAVTGAPYDTLQSVIGITKGEASGSLADFGVRYEQIELTPDSLPDLDTIANRLKKEVGGQAVLGRQHHFSTPWLTERHGYDPTSADLLRIWVYDTSRSS